MSSDLAISVRGVSKAYHIYERPQDRLKQMLWRGGGRDEFWALRDIDFDVMKGETVGIVGRNGSGKSTLLQIICGTVTPTTGAVQRDGRISALLELGSGFNPEFTGRENVFLNGAIIGLSRAEMEERFDRIAAFADIGDFIDSPVKHYSSGMFARLAFSVAIHVDPEVLIVDEILAVGDIAFQRRCMNKFYEIRDGGCSILFVSHDQYQVKSICQRALYLDQGRQRLFGSAGNVIDQYMIDMEEKVSRSSDLIGNDSQHDVSERAGTTCMELPEVAEVATLEGIVIEPAEKPASASQMPEQVFRITQVVLSDEAGNPVDLVTTGQSVRLTFDFVALAEPPPERISFVFNLYRHDDLYLCGTTTLMDGIEPYTSSKTGTVSVDFCDFSLLSGQYKWRVAINDQGGFITYAEAKGVCSFRVQDEFKAVGMFNLPRAWSFEPGVTNDSRIEIGTA